MSTVIDVVMTETVIEIIGSSEAGPSGPGVPPGGTATQVLAKASDDDYDNEWVDIVAGASGPAGGVLGGSYPNPGFAADMATQAELDAGLATKETPGGAQTKADGAQAFARQRGNHTGSQPASSISDFDTQVRTSRLDQLAAPTGDVSFNGHRAVLLQDPVAAQDAATKAWVLAQLAVFTAGAPGSLDSFLEAYNQFLTDEAAVAALTAIVGGKLAAAANLSDVANAVTALANLGGQPLNTNLTQIAALATTSFGRALLTMADAAAIRSAAGLGTAALVNTGTGAANVPTVAQADARYQGIGTYLVPANIDDTAYDATSWNADTTHAPTKNAVRDKFETLSTAQVPTAVKTANYTAAVGDLVPCDTSGGAFTVTLPNAPADKSLITIELVTAGFPLTVARGGTDVFTKAGGATSVILRSAGRSLVLQYKSSTGIWYVLDHVPTHSALVLINPLLAPHTQTNWTTIGSNSSAYTGGYRQSAAAVGSQITWDVVLSAGLWDLSFSTLHNNTSGIITVSISPDGTNFTTVGTIDLYNAASSFKNIESLTGISVPSDGYWRLKFDMLTRNASSGNYQAAIEGLPMQLKRTDVPLT